MGTSHRAAPVKDLVGAIRSGLRDLFDLPEGYEVVIGLGGTHAFWDSAAFGLIDQRAQALVNGEFSRKFATAIERAPFLADPMVIESDPWTHPMSEAVAGIDTYCWVHNETSTGVMAPVVRVDDADPDALVLIDATSAAGGLDVDISQCDVYYFSAQKGFASDGGLWFAIMSPAALERADRLLAERWVPSSLDLRLAIDNSRKNQTYNTPAIATLSLMHHQLTWLVDHGGLDWAAARCSESATHLYSWAEKSTFAAPFVTAQTERSLVVATVDLDGVDQARISDALRANGIVDVDSYRGLGRNQLRIGMFPAVDPADIRALTDCIDWVAERLD